MVHDPTDRPRLSANELALYMMQSETARIKTIRQAKFPLSANLRAIRYSDARKAICNFLLDSVRSISHLTTAENMLAQRASDNAVSCYRRNDAKHSIYALHDIQKIRNKIARYHFIKAPKKQRKLNISGVDISVKADVIVEGQGHRSGFIGAAILQMKKDDDDIRRSCKTKKMGTYVAALISLHVEKNLLKTGLDVDPELCMSIDVQHHSVFFAPSSRSNYMKEIENACHMIAAMWPQITQA